MVQDKEVDLCFNKQDLSLLWFTKVIIEQIFRITTNESFAEKWIKTYSVPFLESTLIILKARDIKNHAQDYLTNVAISYINSAIRIAYAYQYIYKELNFILQDVIFINIRMTEDDIELWRDDPIE